MNLMLWFWYRYTIKKGNILRTYILYTHKIYCTVYNIILYITQIYVQYFFFSCRHCQPVSPAIPLARHYYYCWRFSTWCRRIVIYSMWPFLLKCCSCRFHALCHHPLVLHLKLKLKLKDICARSTFPLLSLLLYEMQIRIQIQIEFELENA